MYIASVSDSLKVWDVSDYASEYRCQSTQVSESEYLCLSWNHTNQVVAVGGRENKVRIIQASNGQLLQSLEVTEAKLTHFKVPSISFSHNSRYLTVSVENTIQLWDLKKRQIKSVLSGHKSPVVSLQFNSNGDFFGADEEGSIKLWSPKTNQAVNITEDNRGIRPIYSLTKLAISPIAPVIAAGYDDGTLRVWDITSGINLTCQLPTHESKITDVSCSTKNARLLATASLDERIHLIDTAAPSRYVCSSINVEQRAMAISFHEDGMYCAVGAADGTILMYDWRNASEPVSITSAHEPFPVQALSFQSYRPSAMSSAAEKEPNSEYTTETIRSSAEKAKLPKPATRSLEEDLAVFEKKEKKPMTTVSTISPASAAPPVPPRSTIPSSTSLPTVPATSKLIGSPFRRSDEVQEDIDQVPTRGGPSKSSLRHNPPPSVSSSVDSAVPVRTATMPLSSSSSSAVAATAAKVSIAEEKSNLSFEDKYKQRVGAYLEVGQDRIHRREREEEEDTMHSIQRVSLATSSPSLPIVSSAPSHSAVPHQATASSYQGNYRDGDGDGEEFAALREAVRPVTHKELEEALDLLKYDVHQELQEVIREQVRQFTIAKDETATLIKELSLQLKDLVRANEELREENAYLRKLY